MIKKLLRREPKPIYAPSTESVRNYEQAERNKRSLANYYTRSYFALIAGIKNHER